MITAEKLRILVSYDPKTGIFTWKKPRPNCTPGVICGGLKPSSHGYLVIRVEQRDYLAHRLAWLYMMGEWPPYDVDHINMDKLDNRWVNLRAATRSQNKANVGLKSTNTTGYKGVYKDRYNRWISRIMKDYKKIHIGSFGTAEEAHAAYQKKAVELFGEFARSS